MTDEQSKDRIVFVNLLREERQIDESSIIDRSLRAVERWASERASIQKIDELVSKAVGIEPAKKGNAVMHEQVESFRQSLKPGECGVFAHGNWMTVIDDRLGTPPGRDKMTALGIEQILKQHGCTSDMPVILYSCNTGHGATPLALELSAYDPTVVAPDGFIAEFVTDSHPGIYRGDEKTGSVDYSDVGQWRVFSHGKEIARYDWGSEQIHQPSAHELEGPAR